MHQRGFFYLIFCPMHVKSTIVAVLWGLVSIYLFNSHRTTIREYETKVRLLEKLVKEKSNRARVEYSTLYVSFGEKDKGEVRTSMIPYKFMVGNIEYKGKVMNMKGDIHSKINSDSVYYLSSDPTINAVNPEETLAWEVENGRPWGLRLYLSLFASALAVIYLVKAFRK